MTHESLRPSPRSADHEPASALSEVDISRIANRVFASHGMRGIRLTIADGGTYCRAEDSGGMTINIDPSEIANGHELTPDQVLAAAVHEIGHAIDTIEGGRVKHSHTDRFFWNLIDDIAIDAGARRIPAVNKPMENLYRTAMADRITDQTTKSLASQLMYGMRIGQVLGEKPLLDKRVQAMIDGLRKYTASDGTKHDIIASLAGESTNLLERREIAGRYIKPLYDELLAIDRSEGRSDQLDTEMAEYKQTHAHHDDQTNEGQSTASLPEQISQAVENMTKSISDDVAEGTDGTQDKTPANSVNDNELSEETKAKAAGRMASEMQLSPADATGYLELALTYKEVIRGIAKVFQQLARPTSATQRMTYGRRKVSDGPIIHTAAISDIALGQQIGIPPTHIWRGVIRSAERRTKEFGGLDIHLLVDVSGSMAPIAPEATAMAVSLLEGLKLAQAQVTRSSRLRQPDVRTHIVAFGSSTHEITPLSHSTTLQQMGLVYSNLMAPNAWATLINDALRSCRPSSNQADRDSIILIVSDGVFGDHDDAIQTVETLPGNVYVGQLIIGDYRPITPNFQSIVDVAKLPEHLLHVLRQYIKERN